jgi:antitoxin component YwqK of YwqJK toxin-antitoxin module
MTKTGCLIALCALSLSCADRDPEKERLQATTRPSYDTATGKLTELTFDFDKNGKIDTWTQMQGGRPVLTRMDRDEDGKIDRWEYLDENAKLVKVGFSRGNTGTPDAWAYEGADGQVERVEVSSRGDETRIDRWERYRPGGVLLEADEDTDHDGRADKWETYDNGTVKTVAFDENRDGRADRRLTYDRGTLVTVETEPDASGKYLKSAHVR